MTWVKLSDTFADDPRFEEIGAEAAMVHVAALCYCSRNLTDGRIAPGAARRLFTVTDIDKSIEALVEVGLWRRTETGFELVDYLNDQPTAERVREQQQLKRERQQRWLDTKRDASRNTSRDASKDGAPPRPAPPRREAGRGGRRDDSARAPSSTARSGENTVVPAAAGEPSPCPHDVESGLAMEADGRRRCRACEDFISQPWIPQLAERWRGRISDHVMELLEETHEIELLMAEDYANELYERYGTFDEDKGWRDDIDLYRSFVGIAYDTIQPTHLDQVMADMRAAPLTHVYDHDNETGLCSCGLAGVALNADHVYAPEQEPA